MANVERLRRTMSHIMENPWEWEQDSWVCDTKACFAGRTCLLEGYVPCGRETAHFWDKDIIVNRRVHCHDLAQELLQLSQADSQELFYLNNSIDRLQELVEQFCWKEERDAARR